MPSSIVAHAGPVHWRTSSVSSSMASPHVACADQTVEFGLMASFSLTDFALMISCPAALR